VSDKPFWRVIQGFSPGPIDPGSHSAWLRANTLSDRKNVSDLQICCDDAFNESLIQILKQVREAKMAVDGSGRVRLLGSAQLLHPEQQTFDDMLDGPVASCQYLREG
jgi:hypothetical protein